MGVSVERLVDQPLLCVSASYPMLSNCRLVSLPNRSFLFKCLLSLYSNQPEKSTLNIKFKVYFSRIMSSQYELQIALILLFCTNLFLSSDFLGILQVRFIGSVTLYLIFNLS